MYSMDEKKVLKLLRKVEWKGTRVGQESSMGANDGPIVAACPCCWSVAPGSMRASEFPMVGHAKDCQLGGYIKELSIIAEAGHGHA